MNPPPLLRFEGQLRRDPAIDRWFADQRDELRALAEPWFDVIRACGEDVRESMHDGMATACVDEAPFASVGIYKVHVNVGLFYGALLDDPAGLLEGTGKRGRHVKLRPGEDVDRDALRALIRAAYEDILERVALTPHP